MQPLAEVDAVCCGGLNVQKLNDEAIEWRVLNVLRAHINTNAHACLSTQGKQGKVRQHHIAHSVSRKLIKIIPVKSDFSHKLDIRDIDRL